MATRTLTTEGIDRHVYYGVCTTGASTAQKIVTIKNPTLYQENNVYYLDLNEGDQLIVSFTNTNTAENPQIILRTVDSQTDIGTYIVSGRLISSPTGDILPNCWGAGDVVSFTYTINTSQNISYWVINNYGPASQSRYGTVKLVDSGDGNSYNTDEHAAASIPKIISLIGDKIIEKLRLDVVTSGNNSNLVLKYGTTTLSGGSTDVSVPQTTSDLINDGARNSNGKVANSLLLYKVGNSITESGTSLQIGAISSGAITASGNITTSGNITATNSTNGKITARTLEVQGGGITTSGNITATNSTNGIITARQLAVQNGGINSFGSITTSGNINATNSTNGQITARRLVVQSGGISNSGTLASGSLTVSGNITTTGTGIITAAGNIATDGNIIATNSTNGIITVRELRVQNGGINSFGSIDTEGNINALNSTNGVVNARILRGVLDGSYIENWSIPSGKITGLHHQFSVVQWGTTIAMENNAKVTFVSEGWARSDWQAYRSVALPSWTAVGVVGFNISLSGNPGAVFPAGACYQDCYLEGEVLYMQPFCTRKGEALFKAYVLYIRDETK